MRAACTWTKNDGERVFNNYDDEDDYYYDDDNCDNGSYGVID